MVKAITISIVLFLFCTRDLKCQQVNLPYSQDKYYQYNSILNKKDIEFHTSIKPFRIQELVDALPTDSLKLLVQKKAADSLKPFQIKINPIGGSTLTYDLENKENSLETYLGASLTAWWKNKIAANILFYSANSSFPAYLDSNINQTSVVPGLGYAHGTKLGYTYKNLDAYISYSPNRIFNFQIGKSKNFIGDGYRSLLLSDNANNYPFFKINTSIWKIKYVNLFVNFKDVTGFSGNTADFQNKFASIHYLSWNISKRINVAFFESIIWQSRDSASSLAYDVNYLNPVIFFRPVEYSVGSADNALMGGSFKIKIARKQQLYGQIILDEFLLSAIRARTGWWANKQGVQIGARSFDLFKINKLDWQGEFNYVRPFTYSHSLAIQNYGHFSQPLAHPSGANFYEAISFLTYRHKQLLFEGKAIYSVVGTDTSGFNFGQNIYKSYTSRKMEYGNTTGQGLENKIIYGGFRVLYTFKRFDFLQLEAGVLERLNFNTQGNTRNSFVFVGVKTPILNSYRDF